MLNQSVCMNPGQPTATPVPGFMYGQQPLPQPSPPTPVGTYDWASDPELWGADFEPGHVEHSGKIMLFLNLLEGCVLAGDKILAFTQSLYTLDLLERILRRLPLPGVKQPDDQNDNSSSKMRLDAPVSNSNPNEKCTVGTNPDKSLNGFPEHCTNDDAPDSVPHDATAQMCPPSDPLKTDNLTLTEQSSLNVHPETDIDSLDDSKFLQSVLEEAKPEPLVSVSEACAEEAHKPDSPKVAEQGEQEETLRSLHYRLSSRLGRSARPTVWTKNVHYFRE